MKLQVDLSALGLKKGLLHVYLDDGEFFALAQSLSKLQGVQSAAVPIGNSDVVLEFLFRDSSKILRLISKVKKSKGVERIVWSEQVQVIHSPFRLESTPILQ